MINKKLWVTSVIAYFVLTMIVAMTWHMFLFHEKYLALGALTREQPIMVLGMSAVLLQAMVFAYFYPLYYRAKRISPSIGNGIVFTWLLGINVWTVMVFATAAKFNIEPVSEFLFLASAFQLIQFTIVGAALGLIHTKWHHETIN